MAKSSSVCPCFSVRLPFQSPNSTSTMLWAVYCLRRHHLAPLDKTRARNRNGHYNIRCRGRSEGRLCWTKPAFGFNNIHRIYACILPHFDISSSILLFLLSFLVLLLTQLTHGHWSLIFIGIIKQAAGPFPFFSEERKFHALVDTSWLCIGVLLGYFFQGQLPLISPGVTLL